MKTKLIALLAAVAAATLHGAAPSLTLEWTRTGWLKADGCGLWRIETSTNLVTWTTSGVGIGISSGQHWAMKLPKAPGEQPPMQFFRAVRVLSFTLPPSPAGAEVLRKAP